MANGDKNKGRAGGLLQQADGSAPGATVAMTRIKVPTLPGAEVGSPSEESIRDLRGVVLDDRYVLKERVNGGNMGEIWLAKDLKLWNKGDHWLVKILPSVFAGAKAYTEALLREAHLTSGLSGDYFPLIVDVGVTDGIAWLVMQGIPGEDLRSYLEKRYPTGMQAKDAIPILLRILEGLAMAHKRGVIHRDIKPDNLLIEHEEGSPAKVRILDFGVAKAQSEVFATLSKTLPNGTQQFRPPESHKAIPGAATPGGDIFAVGLTAYQMLLGRHPLAGSDYVARYKRGEELGALDTDRAGARAGVDSAFAAVLNKAVAFDPEERYQDATEMLEALEFATTFRPEAIPKGAIIDRSYRVLSSLGAGGMGAVYNAVDIHRKKDEELLLKVLVCPPGASEELQDSLRERFRRECESLYGVEHDAIPRIFSNGSHEGVPYLVMEKAKGYALGQCFEALLAKGGWDAMFRMSRCIASALDTIHARGLIHRDIKPPNIVVDPESGDAMVIDFGIVRVDDTVLTSENTFIGTPGFAAPEQMAGEAVKESDQWSLGATLYHLLSGIYPGDLPGENREEVSKVHALNRLICDDYPSLADLELLHDVPPSIVGAVVKAMSGDPADRFASVADFARAMEAGVANSSAPVVPRHNLSVNAFYGGPTESAEPMAQPLPPQGLGGSLSAATDIVARGGKRGPYMLLVALIGLLVVGGGAYKLTRTDSVPASAGGHAKALAGTGPTLVAVASADASVPVSPRDVAPAAETTSVHVTVMASIEGRPVTGLGMRIGEVALKNSDSISLPLGEVVVHVGAGNYEGVYTCEITPDSKVCDIVLAKALKKQRRPSKRRPKIDDGEEDMINFREDKP